MKAQRAKSFSERFWEKVRIPEDRDECWLWMGGKSGNPNSRYGVFRGPNGAEKAHRVAYGLENGPFPTELFVCHACDTPLCVNPKHLFLGTAADNAHDRDKKGRQRSKRGEAHGMSSLVVDGVSAIRELQRKHAKEISELAERLGVSDTTVRDVMGKRTWNWLE